MININTKKRWGYLGIGTVILIFGGLIYAWSLFSRYFEEMFPSWSLTQLSMTFTISMCCFCISGLVAGILGRKMSPASILRIAAILTLAGFLGLSLMNPDSPGKSLLILYICYGVVASAGIGFCYNVVISVTGRWFPDKSGISVGVLMMGFGCGALILGGAAAGLIEKCGLTHAYAVMGAAAAAAVFIGSIIIKNPEKDGEEKGAVSDDEMLYRENSNDRSSKEVLRTPSFWIFMCWSVTSATAGMMVIGNAAAIAVSAGAAAIVGMIVSVCNGAGRIVIGAVFDRFGRNRTLIFSMILLLLSSVLLVSGTQWQIKILVVAGLMISGIQYGSGPVISSSFVREEYGERYYSSNFALINFTGIPSAIIGPSIASRLVTSHAGSYIDIFYVMGICAFIAAVIFMILNVCCRRKK